jgi:hypothetical protein
MEINKADEIMQHNKTNNDLQRISDLCSELQELCKQNGILLDVCYSCQFIGSDLSYMKTSKWGYERPFCE